jgi:lipopolysaccharide export system permease protein
MRLTLTKYISKEIWGIFATCLIVLIFIMMTFEMMDMTDLMVNQGVGITGILKLILCGLPKFILFAMPAACLMGVLLAYIRMSGDNEIIAIYSSGISLYQTLIPVIIFCLTSFFLSSLMAIYLVPYGNRTDKSVFYEIVQEKTDISVKERIIEDLTKDVIYYVSSYSPKDRYMKDIIMVDKRQKPVTTIVAKKGIIIPNKEAGSVSIRFFDTYLYTGKTTASKHETFNYTVDLSNLISTARSEKEPEDMYINELLKFINSGKHDESEVRLARLTLYEMISIPVSIFLLGIIGAPLGAHVRDRGRTAGIVISLVLFLLYYISMMAVRYLIELGVLIPGLGVWIPVLFLLIFSLFLLFRYSSNLSYGLLESFFIKSR